ncbi:hypothetical protein ACVIKP_004856 [Rhizobium leguminosarum]
MAPPPGRMPSAEPIAVPRMTGAIISLNSWRDGKRPDTLAISTVRVDSPSRLRRISATPKTPTASATKFSPSAYSRIPSVKRGVPV